MNNPLIFVAIILLLISFITTIWGMIKNSAIIVGGGVLATDVVLLVLMVGRFLH